MNDKFRDMMPDCAEAFTEDMGPAHWANESDTAGEQSKNEDSDFDYSDGYGSPADDAWHDANEYPDW